MPTIEETAEVPTSDTSSTDASSDGSSPSAEGAVVAALLSGGDDAAPAVAVVPMPDGNPWDQRYRHRSMWEMADDYRNDPKIKTRAKKPAIPGSLLQAILDNGVEIGRAAIMLEVTRSHLYNALARHRNRADHNEVVEDAAVIVQPPADDSAIPLAQAPQRLEAAPPHLNVALVEMVAEMISSNDLVPGTYSAADGTLKCDVLEQDHNGLYQPRVLEWRTKQAQVAKILTLARELESSLR